DFVRRMEPVTGAKANSISGSLLVTYDPRRAPRDFPVTMQAEIEGWLAGARSSGASFAGARRGALSRVFKVALRRRGEGIGPVLLSVGGYVLTILQGLTSAAIVDVAKGGGTAGGLSRFGLTTSKSQLKGL